MIQQKIDDISCFIDELDELKTSDKILGTTKIYGQGIFISLTSNLSEAISNYYAKNQEKIFKETTVDELIDILKLDIKQKKLILKKEKSQI